VAVVHFPKKKIVDKQFILDAKHLISFERSLKQLSKGMYIEIKDVPFKKID
jgi:hypothetical protein